MEKLFQTHKDLVVTVIVILSILLCVTFYSDPAFRLVDLAIIALIAAGIVFLVGMVSGYSSSKSGASRTEDTASSTTNVIWAFGLAFGAMLLADILYGHGALIKTECCMGGIAAIIILVMLSPLGGPSSHKAGNRHDRTVIGEHGGTRSAVAVDTTEETEEKSSKLPWIVAGVAILLILLFSNSRNNESPVTMVPYNNQSNQQNQIPSNNSNQAPNNVTVNHSNQEAGQEVKGM